MAKKRPGKLWFEFKLFGLDWEARIAPAKCAALDKGATMASCYYNERYILMSDALSNEQMRTTLAHELQHAIEDHADVDHEYPASADVSDRWTDQLARGWLYVIRECPEIIGFLRAEHTN
jgi:hypothetical protein